jgi:hypothetical protein
MTMLNEDDLKRNVKDKGYGAARVRTRASGVVEGCAVSNEEDLTSRKK